MHSIVKILDEIFSRGVYVSKKFWEINILESKIIIYSSKYLPNSEWFVLRALKGGDIVISPINKVKETPRVRRV